MFLCIIHMQCYQVCTKLCVQLTTANYNSPCVAVIYCIDIIFGLLVGKLEYVPHTYFCYFNIHNCMLLVCICYINTHKFVKVQKVFQLIYVPFLIIQNLHTVGIKYSLHLIYLTIHSPTRDLLKQRVTIYHVNINFYEV